MQTATLCAHFRVRGRVQGVFYRASAEATARRLNLSGWVRNAEDGDVELVACGPAARLDELEKWLWQGPANAQVTSVEHTSLPPQNFRGFEIRR
jgi:acylphosphatase